MLSKKTSFIVNKICKIIGPFVAWLVLCLIGYPINIYLNNKYPDWNLEPHPFWFSGLDAVVILAVLFVMGVIIYAFIKGAKEKLQEWAEEYKEITWSK